TALNDTTNASANPQDGAAPLPTYEEVLKFITDNGYQEPEILRTQKNTIYSELISKFPSISDSLANNILDSLKEGKFTREEYNNLTTSTGDAERDK
ncbi:hypothetical protein ACEWFX_11370, partial [Bifidobacterium longum subsp. suis]